MDFRHAKEEKFLFDTGAQVCIMGETMTRDNKIKIKRLAKPKIYMKNLAQNFI